MFWKCQASRFQIYPWFWKLTRFVGVIEQNKICNSFCQYCIRMDRREITKSIVQILLFIIFLYLFGEPSYNDYMRRDVVMKESKSSVYTFPALTICLVWTIYVNTDVMHLYCMDCKISYKRSHKMPKILWKENICMTTLLTNVA